MKINLLSSALVAIVGLALIGAPLTAPAQTNTPAAAAPAKTSKKSAKTEYKGSITAIDATSITVASTQKTLTMAITPATKFALMKKKQKLPAKASDFAVGDAVTGSYSTDATGALTANSVHKKAPAAASASAAPAAQ
jgi:hypothetical protein